ncbi:hypothetical protein EV359DRAFT_86980, partial [Lentinula novae-zelandiae]
SPTPNPLLWDLHLSNVEATPYVELRAASPLPPPILGDVHPQTPVPGTSPPRRIPSQELTPSRPIYIYDLFDPILTDLPGPPRNPLKGHHLVVPATTRSFPSSVAVPVAPFELQPAPSTLQHKPSYTKTYPKTYSDPGLTALHTASMSSMHNLANSLRRAVDLNDQMKQIGSLFNTARELFLRSILDLQNAGEDPVVVLEALKAAEPNRRAINLNEWTLMATLFHWPSPFNLSGLDFNNQTPGEWIDLLCSIHSGESMARVDEDRHLVESSPPPDSAAEALEGLNDVERGSADEGTSSQVGGSIPMELDLPMIESLAEPTLSPEKGAEPAQTL